jgi:hypothetical protein
MPASCTSLIFLSRFEDTPVVQEEGLKLVGDGDKKEVKNCQKSKLEVVYIILKIPECEAREKR